MIYVIKYRYIDDTGDEKNVYWGYNRKRDLACGVESLGSPHLCAYFSKRTALEVKAYVGAVLESERENGLIGKAWKPKVIGVDEFRTKARTAEDNAAIHYYWTFLT